MTHRLGGDVEPRNPINSAEVYCCQKTARDVSTPGNGSDLLCEDPGSEDTLEALVPERTAPISKVATAAMAEPPIRKNRASPRTTN